MTTDYSLGIIVDKELHDQIEQLHIDSQGVCETALRAAVNDGDPWWSESILKELRRRDITPENTQRVIIDIQQDSFIQVHVVCAPKMADIIPALIQHYPWVRSSTVGRRTRARRKSPKLW